MKLKDWLFSFGFFISSPGRRPDPPQAFTRLCRLSSPVPASPLLPQFFSSSPPSPSFSLFPGCVGDSFSFFTCSRVSWKTKKLLSSLPVRSVLSVPFFITSSLGLSLLFTAFCLYFHPPFCLFGTSRLFGPYSPFILFLIVEDPYSPYFYSEKPCGP